MFWTINLSYQANVDKNDHWTEYSHFKLRKQEKDIRRFFLWGYEGIGCDGDMLSSQAFGLGYGYWWSMTTDNWKMTISRHVISANVDAVLMHDLWLLIKMSRW